MSVFIDPEFRIWVNQLIGATAGLIMYGLVKETENSVNNDFQRWKWMEHVRRREMEEMIKKILAEQKGTHE